MWIMNELTSNMQNTTSPSEIQTETLNKKSPLWRRILRKTLVGIGGILGTVLAICLIYILFFLHYRCATPPGRVMDTSPIAGFDIPETYSVEETALNPYTREEYAGYTIHRYHFQSQTEDITDFDADWFEPRSDALCDGGKRNPPLVMLGPITGGGYHLENIFSRYFADHGMAVFLVHRPKEYDRDDKKIEEMGYWWRMMARQSRLAYHWALDSQSVDPSRTATFGISNGGFRHTFFAALEPDIQAHVICLAGGNLAEIVTYSDFESIAKNRSDLIKENQITENQFTDWIRDKIDLEPNDYAAHVDPQTVLMICARFDTVIPYKNGMALWEAFGRPELIAVPFGHYSTAFAIPYLKREAKEFMLKRFETVD